MLTFKIVILSYMMLVYNRFDFGSPFKMDVFGSYARTKFAIFFVFYQCCQCCCCLSTIFGGNFPICQEQRKLSQQRRNNNVTIRPLIRFRTTFDNFYGEQKQLIIYSVILKSKYIIEAVLVVPKYRFEN